MFEFISKVIRACQFRKPKEGSLPSGTPDCWEGLLEEVQAAKARRDREWQQALTDAHAAAASGEGPQPWDRDWIEFQVDIEDDIREIAGRIGWHRTQDFLEILDWAVASPQGQRALAGLGDAASPGQSVLELIEELVRPLTEASHQMLSAHAKGLGYTDEIASDLAESLDELALSLYNITRAES